MVGWEWQAVGCGVWVCGCVGGCADVWVRVCDGVRACLRGVCVRARVSVCMCGVRVGEGMWVGEDGCVRGSYVRGCMRV
jgi:hypothetical protein